MGFVDKIGKAISDVGQKGKDLASVAKFNRMIADEERDCAKIFEQIGKKYYDLHLEDFDEDFSELIGNVKESFERIQSYKDTVDELQGIVRCPSCGTDLPSGASFCPECGFKIPVAEAEEKKEQDPDKIYCVECGSVILDGAKFCTVCGAKAVIPEPEEEPCCEAEEKEEPCCEAEEKKAEPCCEAEEKEAEPCCEAEEKEAEPCCEAEEKEAEPCCCEKEKEAEEQAEEKKEDEE